MGYGGDCPIPFADLLRESHFWAPDYGQTRGTSTVNPRWRRAPRDLRGILGDVTSDAEAPAPTVPAPIARAQVGVCLGCGSLILLSFLALGYTVWRSDRSFTNDPAAVEATLRSIVDCQIPPGYRGFVGADVPDRQRIAVLAPVTLEGRRLKLDVPLLISAWTFPPGTDTEQARADAVIGFWTTQVTDRELILGKKLHQTREVSELKLRGEAHPATKVVYECERVTVQLIYALLPRTPGSPELIALAFTGDAATFDEEAVQAFLASVR
jgi:hypothetical protein